MALSRRVDNTSKMSRNKSSLSTFSGDASEDVKKFFFYLENVTMKDKKVEERAFDFCSTWTGMPLTSTSRTSPKQES